MALSAEEEFTAIFNAIRDLSYCHPENERDLKARYGIPFVEADGSVDFPDNYIEFVRDRDIDPKAVAKLIGVDPDKYFNMHLYWTTSGCYGDEEGWNSSGCEYE